MFTTPCYIRKNTKELRARLEELGYETLGDNKFPVMLADDSEITTHEDEAFFDCLISDPIDCRTNEALFLALAALRDDTDMGQWFVDKGNWFLCHQDCVEWEYGEGAGIYAHKATPAELVEHFKEK